MMKRLFVILLLILMLLSISACSSEKKPVNQKVTAEPEITSAEEMPEQKPSESAAAAESSAPEDSEGDFQKDIPPEYRLKQNVPDDYYAPLPTSEITGFSSFFDSFGGSLSQGSPPA